MKRTRQRQSTNRTDAAFTDPHGWPELYTWPGVDRFEPDALELGDRAANALGCVDIYRDRHQEETR